MNTFKRIGQIFSSNVNHALDKLENPSKIIRYSITKMEDTLAKAKESAAETRCNIKGREKALEEYNAATTRWEIRAQMAVKNGKDDLAKEAIAEKQRSAARAKAVEEELTTLRSIQASQEARSRSFQRSYRRSRTRKGLLSPERSMQRRGLRLKSSSAPSIAVIQSRGSTKWRSV